MRRSLGRLLTACAVAALTLLSGCASTASDGKTVIKWWMVTPSSDQAGTDLQKVVDEYNAAHPDVRVDLQFRAVDPLKNALRLTAGSTASPDIYYMWAGPGLGGEFVDAGISLDLTKYYDKYDWKDRFNAGTLKNYTQYGGYQGVPWTQRGEVIFYNKALFTKAGITATPTTYDELVADAAKLKAAGITPISLGGKDNWHIMRLLDAIIETKCGSELGDKLTQLKVSWADQPCVNESFTELKTWGDNYFESGYAGLGQSDAAALFQRNEAAMEFEGDWFTASLTKPDDYGVFVFPTGTGRLYGFSEGMYITKTSEHPDESAEFLNYLTSKQVQSTIGADFAATSVNKAVTFSGASNSLQDAMQQIITSAKGYYLNNDQNFPVNVTTEYWRIQNAVLAGDIRPADAGRTLQTFIDSNKN